MKNLIKDIIMVLFSMFTIIVGIPLLIIIVSIYLIFTLLVLIIITPTLWWEDYKLYKRNKK